MANAKRARNRAISSSGGGGIPSYRGSGGDHGVKGRTSGSYAHQNERHGPGPSAGAGELDMTAHHVPGRAAGRVRPDNTENPMRGTGKAGKPGKAYSEE